MEEAGNNPDFEQLWNALVPFANQQLEEHGAFHPFAACVDSEGELRAVDAWPEGDEPQEVDDEQTVDLITSAFRDTIAEGGLRAAGLCMDVRVTPPDSEVETEAILVRLDHATDEALDVFLPYQRTDEGEVEYDEPFATDGTLDVFTKSE